ncbi:hypothetical protein M0657_001243 [Pyricularia oryzae]|nr:hypothetical protein M9X92_004206 [Pyricularia oryzae]KAI7931289.1 hypothetical protein M0657_001243 [Pyricularia oryzae]
MSGIEAALGAVGTINTAAGIVGQGFRVYRLVKKVHDQVIEGPAQMRDWMGEIETLTSIAKEIRSTSVARLDTEDIDKILVRCKSHMDKLEKLFQPLCTKVEQSKARKIWKAICTIEQRDDIMQIFGALEREKTALTPLITLRTFNYIESKIDEMRISGESLSDEDSQKCIAALFLVDPTAVRSGLLTNKGDIVQGTCDWIVNTPEFSNWESVDGGILWISGCPGMGKTMLSIFLSQHLEASTSAGVSDSTKFEGEHLITYFFCDNRDNRRNNPVAIVRGLLTMLLRRCPGLIKYIVPSFKVQGTQLFQQSSLESLWSIFIDMVNDPGIRRVSCILDGLDECEPIKALETLLKKIKSVSNSAPRLSIIVASREYPKSIGNAMRQAPRIRLDPDHKADVNEGLEAYINSSVHEFGPDSGGDLPLHVCQRVKDTLKERSKGTFLWVSFAIADLQGKEAAEVEDCLEQLPTGLDDVYARMLAQVEASRRDIVRRILSWTVFSKRPLRLSELASALGVQPKGALTKLEIIKSYIAYCGHFLTISKPSEEDMESIKGMAKKITWRCLASEDIIPLKELELNHVVELVHQSAKDFLIGNSSALDGNWFAPFNPDLEHGIMASACISCLEADAVETFTRLRDRHHEVDCFYQDFPFVFKGLLGYSCENWFEHMGAAGGDDIDRIFDQHQGNFLNPCLRSPCLRTKRLLGTFSHSDLSNPVLNAWLRLKHFKNWEKASGNYTDGDPTIFAVSCSLGLDFLVTRILDKQRHEKLDTESDASWRGNHPLSSPLLVAVVSGEIEIIKILVKEGAPINGVLKTDGATYVPFWTADTLKMKACLLALGADPNTKAPPMPDWGELDHYRCEGAYPYTIAVRSYFPDLLSLLIAHGADMTLTNEGDSNAMHLLFSENGNWQSDPDRCIHLKSYIRPPYAALKTFHILMEAPNGPKLHQGVDLSGNKPIHLAFWSMESESGILQELLNPKWGLDIWGPNSEGNTTLHLASRSGGTGEGVRLLLARDDVDVNCKNNKGQTPLHLACNWDRPLVWTCPGYRHDKRFPEDKAGLVHDYFDDPQLVKPVELLLGHSGIDLNARDEDGRTPLHLAAANGETRVVKMLLSQSGVDINARDDQGQTPLHRAAAQGYHDFVEAYSIKDYSDRTSALRLLLADDRIEVNARDKDGLTPLQQAVAFGQPQSVQVLLADDRVDANFTSEAGNTLVSYAAFYGRMLIMEMLLADVRIDALGKNEYGTTAVHYAACEGHHQIVKRLLADKRFDINAKTIYSETALHIAAREGKPEVAKVLLAHGGADVNVKSNEGGTPLNLAVHYYARPGCSDIARMLLAEPNTDPCVTWGKGWTALHSASYIRNSEIIKLLIDLGADVNARDDDQETPLYWLVGGAIDDPWKGPVRKALCTLLEAGADPEAKDAEGKTPAEIIASFGGEDAFVEAVESGSIKKDGGEDSKVAEETEISVESA